MHGKTVLVTGASTGIGLAMAAELARLGASVVMVSRDPERGKAAQRRVAEVPDAPTPVFLAADLSSQASVRRLAGAIRDRTDRLDVLIHNAGAAFPKRVLTEDGIERTLAVNHLAPFLLTHLLLDLVRAAPSGRVITVTGELHSGSIDFDDLGLERRYHFLRAYALSKAANIMFTYELARRSSGTRVTANCFSPGPTVTNFGRGAPGLLGSMSRLVRAAGYLHIANTPEQGARMGIALASSPEFANVSGRYYSRYQPRKSKPVTYDPVALKLMWEASDRLCGIAQDWTILEPLARSGVSHTSRAHPVDGQTP